MKNSGDIWIVDDDMSVREIMQVILAEEGYNVRTYASENELNKSLENEKPCLLYLDILLSGADGRHIAKRLKTDPRFIDIPIIIMSANHKFLIETESAIANDTLTKPFEMDDLLQKTQKYLQVNENHA